MHNINEEYVSFQTGNKYPIFEAYWIFFFSKPQNDKTNKSNSIDVIGK